MVLQPFCQQLDYATHKHICKTPAEREAHRKKLEAHKAKLERKEKREEIVKEKTDELKEVVKYNASAIARELGMNERVLQRKSGKEMLELMRKAQAKGGFMMCLLCGSRTCWRAKLHSVCGEALEAVEQALRENAADDALDDETGELIAVEAAPLGAKT